MPIERRSIDQQASILVRVGRIKEAHDILLAAASANDPTALMCLGIWNLTGSPIGRDLATARRCFKLAAQLGHGDAAAIHIAFLANGTGGNTNWPQAITELRRLSAHSAQARQQLAVLADMDINNNGDPCHALHLSEISQKPYIQFIRGFFTENECAYLIDAAHDFLTPANVIDPRTNKLSSNPIRTSDSAEFPLALENPVIHALNRRIAAASHTDARQGEPLQVLRYKVGQQYKSHSDALPETDNQRILTMLVYLNDDYAGGETLFLSPSKRIRGKAGDAVLFRNVDQENRLDPHAIHAGLPVMRGEKWLASRWIRSKALDLTLSKR